MASAFKASKKDLDYPVPYVQPQGAAALRRRSGDERRHHWQTWRAPPRRQSGWASSTVSATDSRLKTPFSSSSSLPSVWSVEEKNSINNSGVMLIEACERRPLRQKSKGRGLKYVIYVIAAIQQHPDRPHDGVRSIYITELTFDKSHYCALYF